MTKPAPFSVELIQKQWQPINLSSPHLISGEALNYASYYRINFSQQLDSITHSFGYFDASPYRIACHFWRPAEPKGTVFIGHGYFDHVGLYLHVIRYYLDEGFCVIAYDLPGHGLSSGEQASINNFADYQMVLSRCIELMQQANLPKPWHWLAQSTGGAIAMDYLLHTAQPAFDKVVLLAPLVWPFGWSTGKYLHFFVHPFVRYIKRAFATNSHDANFLSFIKERDPLQSRRLSIVWVTAWKKWLPKFRQSTPSSFPLHVIQGDEDTTVSWHKNLPEIKRLFPNVAIHIINQGRHQLVNESSDIRQLIIQNLDHIFTPHST